MADIVIGSASAHTDDVWPLGFDGTAVPTCTADRVADEKKMVDDYGRPGSFHYVEPLCDTICDELGGWPTRTLWIRARDGQFTVVDDSIREDVKQSTMWVKETGLY